jgi:hypothetical protein
MTLDEYIEANISSRKDTMQEILDDFSIELSSGMTSMEECPPIPYGNLNELSSYFICLGGMHTLLLLKEATSNGYKQEEEVPGEGDSP